MQHAAGIVVVVIFILAVLVRKHVISPSRTDPNSVACCCWPIYLVLS
jgi:hypothetical protein